MFWAHSSCKAMWFICNSGRSFQQAALLFQLLIARGALCSWMCGGYRCKTATGTQRLYEEGEHCGENPGGEGCCQWVRVLWYLPLLESPDWPNPQHQDWMQGGQATCSQSASCVQHTWVGFIARVAWIFLRWWCNSHTETIRFLQSLSCWEEVMEGVQGTD